MKVSKKVLLSVMASILMITVLFAGNVNAATYTIKDVDTFREKGVVGDIIFLKGSDLLNAEDAYCFEHKSEFRGGEYKVWDIVEINGKTAKNLATGKVVTNDENMVMNYILYKGNYERKEFRNGKSGHMSVRNIAIWAYQNTWVNSLGTDFFSKNWKHKYSRYNMSQFNFGDQPKEIIKQAEQLRKDAENYAKNHKGSANIQITGNTQVNEYQKNTYGPFKIKYSGDDISLSVTDLNGNNISNNVIKVYSDKECKNEITKNNIKSNTDFYIKITDGTKIKKLKCTVSSSTLNAKILFTARKDFWNNYGQNIIFVKPGENKEKKSVEFNTKNMKKISIQGYVWIDVQRNKENNTDSLYNDDEARVEDVTVNLVNKYSKKIIATTNTTSDGSYTFKEPFYEEQLKDYYVEFNYKNKNVKLNYNNGKKEENKDISKYIPVAFNSANLNEIVPNGSRAIMNEVAYKDSELSGIATTYTGTEKESTYGLGYNSNLYTKLIDGETLKNINLGIKKIPETEYKITENLAYVKIGMKGYDYTYIYGGAGDTSRVAAPRVKWQNSEDIYAYTREIYPSDIAYDVRNSTEELKADVTYRIDITNTTNHNIEELYKENKLYITSLTNSYDTKRYILKKDNGWSLKNNNQEGIAVYNGDAYKNGINKMEMITSYITFSVKHEAIIDILNHPNGIIEEKPTKAIATGYHQYSRVDYSWNNNITKNQEHITVDDTREADAPYLIFKLGEKRTISGKVFEDKVVTTDGQKLGNGVYDNDENVIPGVKVELLDIALDENKNEIIDITKLPVSNLYGTETNGTNNIISQKAEVITDSNGNYILEGIVPGYYYIRFTYGDGKQKIYDTKGTEIATLTEKDYKSTIVTNETAKKALKGENDFEWYKKLNSTNSSVAIDNLNTRILVNEDKLKEIMAGTAKISITIENTATNMANIEITDEGKNVLVGSKFEGLNLGIIEQPKQEVKFEKIISNIQLINAQNNLRFSGNPETDTVQGVSDLDNIKNNGSKYLRAELEENAISGATLELTYTIQISNISDVNYYNNEYYWYGEADSNKEVTINVADVIDNLDETLQYKSDVSDSRIVSEMDENGKNVLKVKNIGILYTEKNKAREFDNQKTQDTILLVAEKILSNQDDDMEYINEVKISDIRNGTDNKDNSEDKENQIQKYKAIENNYSSKATATITPPTGTDKLEIFIYAIAGVVSLVVLSIGIVVIKKIVKNK